ncbi:MAG: tRNA (adenosine(37)-N6)-threonylcarbamoyltransferase complex dimerization subunit type 1 TsaB [Verrucomicrobiota bacterium]
MPMFENMETILAIETSSSRGSAALYSDGRLLDVREFTSDRSHNSVLFGPLGEILRKAPPLDLIVTGTGPGSYSGIRVGIAAGMGISLARNIPMLGLPSLCGIGEAYSQERYAIAGDARRGSWWYAEVTGGLLTTAPVVDSLEEISRLTARWPGQIFTTDAVSPPFCRALPVLPRAEVLVARANALSVESLTRLTAEPVEPLYLRAPFITVSKKQPLIAPASASAEF